MKNDIKYISTYKPPENRKKVQILANSFLLIRINMHGIV